MAAPATQPAILICGLGKLGQACLRRLRRFDMPLLAMDRHAPDWREPDLEQCLSAPVVIGDMRRPHHLAQAGVGGARAVLLLSSASNVNLEAALQVRLLNPTAQIVVRASGEERQLGDLLEGRLSGVNVVDPQSLMRWALLQALRPGDDAARFEADGLAFALFQGPWQDHRFQRPVQLERGMKGWLVAPLAFHQRAIDRADPDGQPGRQPRHQPRRRWRWSALDRRSRNLLLLSLGLVLVIGAGIHQFSLGTSWQQGVFVTLGLLKGEYVDPVNVLSAARPGSRGGLDGATITGTLLLSLLGTLLTSALVAVILDQLLSARFGLKARPRLPRRARPILLIGGDILSESLAQELQREGHCVWPIDADGRALERVQRSLRDHEVRAIGLLSSDLLANVQAVLALQRFWPQARLAMVASAEQAAEQLGELLGGVTVISSLSLAADVIVATAFGERVEGVWPIGEAMGLLVRYRINADDSLCGQSLARIQNGYGVTTIALRRPSRGDVLALPPLDLLLNPGDQLLVLATLAGLRRIELGQLAPPSQRLQLRLRRPLSAEALFEVHRNLARYLGCTVEAAQALQIGEAWQELRIDPELATVLSDNLRRLGLELNLLEQDAPDGTTRAAKLEP
jgi:Trk K+ transport system NAD-binding subunit